MTRSFSYRRHWGAEIVEGGVRVSLWAPRLDHLTLVARGRPVDMLRSPDGWFSVETDLLGPGDAYAFQLPDDTAVPDPAARAQVGDVHGPSLLVDPTAYRWNVLDWRGQSWEEAVILEVHTGTFSPEGTFAGIAAKLDHLCEVGISAIELMPVAQFGGNRGWGYDGVLHYAPHPAYGTPDDLKALVDAAHARGLMVLLDVVYNHFGPDGNYLHLYAPEFFTDARQTPWGAAIAYERQPVRDFFIDNALYWLEEYRFDGLRLDAVNEIQDTSEVPLLEEIARTVRARIGDRSIHLTTEDDRNITRFHQRDSAGRPRLYTAEWNDDFHHAAHVAATGEKEGYYVDYGDDPVGDLARALAEGYVYQGEISQFWENAPRGEPSADLPPVAMVNFLQNHDQIGNRAFNERLAALVPANRLEALTAILLLSPQIPLIFMGEEWGETNPFGFFTDFDGELADAVREGRRREFKRFERFADPANREKIADPNALETFEASRIDWRKREEPAGKARLDLFRRLLAIRRSEIVPRLVGMSTHNGEATVAGRAFAVSWRLGDGSSLMMTANLDDAPAKLPAGAPAGRVLYRSDGVDGDTMLPPWFVSVFLDAS
ncbi:malto-oligosyltrehalose trehalohydrolase [Breoghania sp. JC706]|uniref:malto-oligosyltrehalose trehalohydrolase n=1 Tax=Breoghania sp. JC706 TaxID=3117732 RepID=UPI00300AC10D